MTFWKRVYMNSNDFHFCGVRLISSPYLFLRSVLVSISWDNNENTWVVHELYALNMYITDTSNIWFSKLLVKEEIYSYCICSLFNPDLEQKWQLVHVLKMTKYMCWYFIFHIPHFTRLAVALW